MDEIFSVSQGKSGSVGQQNIKSMVYHKLIFQAKDTTLHLLFGIHVLPVLVRVTASQSQNPYSLVDIDPVIDTDTSLRRNLIIIIVMISVHIKQRKIRTADEERQVVGVQISTG